MAAKQGTICDHRACTLAALLLLFLPILCWWRATIPRRLSPTLPDAPHGSWPSRYLWKARQVQVPKAFCRPAPTAVGVRVFARSQRWSLVQQKHRVREHCRRPGS